MVIPHDVLGMAVPMLKGGVHRSTESPPQVVPQPAESLVCEFLLAEVPPRACGLHDRLFVRCRACRKVIRKHGFGRTVHRAEAVRQVVPLCMIQAGRRRKRVVLSGDETDTGVVQGAGDEIRYDTLETVRSVGDQHSLPSRPGQSSRICCHFEDDLLVVEPKPNNE